jgi:hypothetical protein
MSLAKNERAERRRAVLLVPDLGTSRVMSLAQGLGSVVPGRETSSSSAASCLSCAAGRFGCGLEDVLLGSTSRAVFLGLVLVACLEPVGAGDRASLASLAHVRAGDGLVGSWFVMGKGAHARVAELIRRLVSTSAGLEMFRGRTAACVVREMCHMRGSCAHVVAAALLRVADVLLVRGGEADAKYNGACDGDDEVMLLVACFSCVVNAVRMQDGSMYDATWKEGLGALDECLLVASTGTLPSLGGRFVRGLTRSGSLGRLRQYLDQISKVEAVMGDAERLGMVFRLRTRLLLVDCAIEGLKACDDGCERVPSMATPTPSVHEVEVLVDDVLFWNSSGSKTPTGDEHTIDGVHGGTHRDSSHERDHLGYVVWLACSTLFDPNLPVFNPNPMAWSKLLCRALMCRETSDHACFPPVAWVLASRVVDPVEQRAVLAVNTDEFGHRKVCMETCQGSSASEMYAWVETQMLLVGNKLAVDDASRRGIVVGQAQEATLRTIRSLLFPCVLFCPYATLHKVFRLSTANRNDAWLMVAVCDVFPDLLRLPALGGNGMDLPALGEDDGIHVEGELARLLVERILSSGAASDPSNEDDESFLYAARALLQAPASNIFFGESTTHENNNRGSLWACLPHMLRAPSARLELASDFVLDVIDRKSAEIDRFTASKVATTCLTLLEFDARYRCLAQDPTAFSKRVLDNARKIVESIVGAGTDSMTGMSYDLYGILSEIESSGAAPWARLYFGIDFSEQEARYILHTNPKPSLGLTTHVKSVTNIRLHQTLELTALGSTQCGELQDLASGYISMSRFLADLQASIRCLFSVCTSMELRHLMNGLEIFCSTLFTRELSWRMAPASTIAGGSSGPPRQPTTTPNPRTVSACSTAMVVELCLKSVPHAQDAPSVVPDICQYCISSAAHHRRGQQSMAHPLTSRLFTELLNYYARQTRTLPMDLHATTALETALSVLYNHRLAPTTRSTFPDPTTTPEFILALLQST